MPNDNMSDEKAMNLIAEILGTNEEWDSPADYLERIADIISWTGRQHPGDCETATYVATRPEEWPDNEEVVTTVGTIRQNYQEGINAGRAQIMELLEKIADDNYKYPGDYEIYYGADAALGIIAKKLKGEPKNV